MSAAADYTPEQLEAYRALKSRDWSTVAKIADEAQKHAGDAKRDPFAAIVYSDGYPAIETPIEWMVRPLMFGPGRPGLVVGPGGIGKTYVVQTIELALENGATTLGGLVPGGVPRRTLHIDADQGIRATRRRFRRLAAGMGLRRFPALLSLGDVLRSDPTFHPTNVAKWRDLFRRFDFVAFDALASLISRFDLDENNTAECRGLIDAVQEASDAEQCTAVLLAHTGKDYRDSKGRLAQQTDPRGASGIKQAAGVQWSFTGSDARGAIRSATRKRDAADDDGDEDLVSEFFYRIEQVHSVATPAMQRRDGQPICGLVVTRTGPPEQTEDTTEGDVRAAVLASLDRCRKLTSTTALAGVVKGHRTRDVFAVIREMRAEGVIVVRDGCLAPASEVSND